MFLHTRLFPVKRSNIIFIVFPSITKLICSFNRVLFVVLFSGHKINNTLIFTVQTIVNLKNASSYCAAKYSSVSYIIANFDNGVNHILRNLVFFAMDITWPEPNNSLASGHFEVRPHISVRKFS